MKALALTILVPLAVSVSGRAGRCSSNSACPNGSECVDNFCSVCSVDAAKCLRSVDRCNNLKCASDEGCYVSEQANADGTVILKLGCFKKNPCTGKQCQSNERCENVVLREQPPIAQCRPNTAVNPCASGSCPDGSRCLVRVGLCGLFPCLVEGVCVDVSDCTSCNYFYQYCDITVEDNNVKGSCVNFMQPFAPQWRPFF